MKNSFFNYLAEASFCLVIFSALYRLLLARLTYFAANRAYLLGALGAAVVLPLLVWPGVATWFGPAAVAPAAGALPFQWTWHGGLGAVGTGAAPGAVLDWPAWLPMVAAAIYLAGAGFRAWGLVRDLRWVQQLARQHPRTWHGGYWLVRVGGAPLPAFSFGRLVFLSAAHDALSAYDRRLLLLHEEVHVRQYHTYDLLVAELVGVLLWFNPLVKYLKTSLKDVHEYLADHAVARASNPQQYGRRLVQLAAQQPPVALVHALSSKQIFARIFTLTQPPSSPMQKLRFLLVVPVVVLT
jgi:hypothetical protein